MGATSFPLPSPDQITYSAPPPHTLSVTPPSLSSVSWACGMLLHCFVLGERSAWWGCPRLTRWFQVQLEATGSRGCRWAIFLVLSPFQNVFLRFLSASERWRWSESRRGGRASPTQAGAILLSKMVPKWLGWLMEWNYTGKMEGNTVLQWAQLYLLGRGKFSIEFVSNSDDLWCFKEIKDWVQRSLDGAPILLFMRHFWCH